MTISPPLTVHIPAPPIPAPFRTSQLPSSFKTMVRAACLVSSSPAISSNSSMVKVWPFAATSTVFQVPVYWAWASAWEAGGMSQSGCADSVFPAPWEASSSKAVPGADEGTDCSPLSISFIRPGSVLLHPTILMVKIKTATSKRIFFFIFLYTSDTSPTVPKLPPASDKGKD